VKHPFTGQNCFFTQFVRQNPCSAGQKFSYAVNSRQSPNPATNHRKLFHKSPNFSHNHLIYQFLVLDLHRFTNALRMADFSYKKRIADSVLERKLNSAGAVLVEPRL